MLPQVFVQHVDEVAAAVRAGDLAVAEHVADRQQLLFQHLHAVAAVGFAAVVAVAEMEQINVPFIGAVMGIQQLLGGLYALLILVPPSSRR